ncbi:hypothetical protein KDL44_10340 [bacterium]|nr:hypothetical protein [bacterium]
MPEQDPNLFRDGHERRMRELEQELEVARRQAEIEKARAEAVVSHLATENHELRQHSRVPQAVPRRRMSWPRRIWLLLHALISGMSLLVIRLLSCGFMLLLGLLAFAFWPEISAWLQSQFSLPQ